MEILVICYDVCCHDNNLFSTICNFPCLLQVQVDCPRLRWLEAGSPVWWVPTSHAAGLLDRAAPPHGTNPGSRETGQSDSGMRTAGTLQTWNVRVKLGSPHNQEASKFSLEIKEWLSWCNYQDVPYLGATTRMFLILVQLPGCSLSWCNYQDVPYLGATTRMFPLFLKISDAPRWRELTVECWLPQTAWYVLLPETTCVVSLDTMDSTHWTPVTAAAAHFILVCRHWLLIWWNLLESLTSIRRHIPM